MEIGAAYVAHVGSPGAGTTGAAAPRAARPAREPQAGRVAVPGEQAVPAAAPDGTGGIAERNTAAVAGFLAFRHDDALAARYAEFARSGARPPLSAAFDRAAAPRFDARA